MVRICYIWHFDAFDENFPLQTSSMESICAALLGVNLSEDDREPIALCYDDFWPRKERCVVVSLNSCPTFLRLRSCASGFLQVERHENTVWVEHVVGEWRTLHESMAPIKRLRRPKILPGACLKT